MEAQFDRSVQGPAQGPNQVAASPKAPLKTKQAWNRTFRGRAQGVSFTVSIQRKADGGLHARYRVHPGAGRDWPMEGILRADNTFVLTGNNDSLLEGTFSAAGSSITARFRHRQFEVGALTLRREISSPAGVPAAATPTQGGSPGVPQGQLDLHKVDPQLRSRIDSTSWKPISSARKDRHAVFHNIIAVARSLGAPFPELIAAQWALESAWGRAPSGKNNLFGIKEFDPKKPRTMVQTHEYNPATGQSEPRLEPFRDYQSYTAGFVDRINLLVRNEAYRKAGFFEATTLRQAITALKKAGYATDAEYVTRIVKTLEGCGINVDTPVQAPSLPTGVLAAPGGSSPPPVGPTASGTVPGQLDALDRLLGLSKSKATYTAAEIRRARQLIVQQPESGRAALYAALQSKVPYHSQRDNTSLGRRTDEANTPFGPKLERVGRPLADIMCNLTTVAMTLESLGIENPDPVHFPQFEDYLEDLRRRLADAAVAKQKTAQAKIDTRIWMHRESQGGWGAVLDAMGTTHHNIQNVGARTREWWEVHALKEIQGGNSVLFSINGHIVRLQGMNDQGLIVDDPFGHLQRLRNSVKGVSPKYRDEQGNRHLNSKSSDSKAGEDNIWSWADVTRYNFLWISIVKAR
ncbi:glycoside hydrolase family 73 protein [Deinococcus hohokamensis]|uniref:Glycoside hydrolase family 73 protein n=1 Tax=Deinococcus hohokamensis TaxID=309883 RepID=A0ABV9IBM5_9DEIO